MPLREKKGLLSRKECSFSRSSRKITYMCVSVYVLPYIHTHTHTVDTYKICEHMHDLTKVEYGREYGVRFILINL